MGERATVSPSLFIAGCILLALGTGLAWADEELQIYPAALSKFCSKFAAIAMLGGALLTVSGCIFFCVRGAPKTLQILGVLAGLGGILCISATLHGINFHSASLLFPVAGLLVVVLGVLMFCVGWLRSRLRQK